MRARRWSLALAIALTAAVTGCTPGLGLPPVEPSVDPVVAASPIPTNLASVQPPGSEAPAPTASGTAVTLTTLVPGYAPTETYPVGVRQLDLTRGDRPLRTVVWYPAANTIGGDPPAVAAGAFPLVLFSHGLTSSPEAYQGITRRFAAAGFIVAAPAYPYTNSAATTYNPADLVNQPADGSAVITALLALNKTAGDPFAGHIDPTRVAAAGHSGGAYTTVGMLAGARDDRLRAAIVIAGGSLGGGYRSPSASVLFVHGDKDPIVSYPIGRATYQQVPWPKAFLTVVNGDHGSYLYAPSSATTAVSSTMVDFLRWSLYTDSAALSRLPSDGTVAGATMFESTL